MGSPLSPIIANLYMEGFESKALASAPSSPTMWLRYVDDTFVLWPHDANRLEEFHSHLNAQHPQIQFTKEEKDDQISFLDVLVKRKDGIFKTSVYRKPTHTDRYTHFTSHHHPRVKTGTIKCLVRRAEKICDDGSRGKEVAHIRNTFVKNGYPKRLISRVLSAPPPRQPTEAEDTPTGKPASLFLPYIQGLSEKIQTACRKIGVRTIFKSRETLRQRLMKVKTRVPDVKKKEIVYKIPCRECDAVYIGETRRSLQKRITEHKYAVKTNNWKNGIAVHAWDNDHQPDWDARETLEN